MSMPPDAAALERVLRTIYDADMQAIDAYQKAHPGTDEEWPEHGKLVAWLLDWYHEHNHLFEMQWAANQRGIALWHAAHPGTELHVPDHAVMVGWLLESVYEATLERVDFAMTGSTDKYAWCVRCRGLIEYSGDQHPGLGHYRKCAIGAILGGPWND